MANKAVSEPPYEPDQVVDRIINELRRALKLLKLLQHEINNAGTDYHLMTPAGALKMLIVTRSEALEENRALKKEVEKLRMQITER